MAKTEEKTGLHLWEMGDIITVNKLNAIVNKISENKRATDTNDTRLDGHDTKLTTIETNITGISYNNDNNSDLTTIDNNVKVNGNLNIVSATDNNLVTITRQVGNAQPANLLSIAPSAMTLSIPATIEGKITVNNAISVEQTESNNLVTRSVAQSLIDTAITAAVNGLDTQEVNCAEFEIFGTISEDNGKISVTTREIPFAATNNNGGYMSKAHVTTLNASAQKVSYAPVTMNIDGNVVTASSTTASATSHEIALGNVVTSLDNVASKAEVNVLSKDINGDYTDANPDNHTLGLKDIIWGREATGDTGAIIGIVEDINKLSPLENLPTTVGRYVLEVTMDDNDNPVVSWVSLENNGGEST